jgi:glycerol kinase
MAQLVLSLDAGTTGIAVLVVDQLGEVQARAYGELTQHYPQPGWVEHDPQEIWSLTRRLMDEAINLANVSSSDIAAIGITNQRETTVLWERRSGTPVAPAVVWQDRRTASICEGLVAEGLEDEVRSRTGLLLDPYFSATKLMWLLDNIDGTRTLAESGELAFGTVDTWLLWNLTGGKVHATEPSNASRTLLYSLQDKDWDRFLLDRFTIPEALLPEVRPSSGTFATTDVLGSPIPIAGMAGDQQAALCGQACFDEGMVKNTYGTGSFVLMNTGADISRSQHRLLSSAAWDLGEGMRYVLEGSIFTTGGAIQWLRDGLKIISAATETERLAKSVQDSGGTYFVPAFSGLGAPYWDPYARGAFLGITAGTTKAHLARAVVEAMAFQTRDVVEAMTSDSNLRLSELRVDGGASVMNLLCEIQADQLGVLVRRPSNLDTTALGAAYLAGLAEGVWSSQPKLAALWRADAEFEPDDSRDRIDAAYAGWRKAVARAQDWTDH